jgi:hypothetical protein
MDHPGAQYLGDVETAAGYLLENVSREDVVITMSAGDANQVGQLLLAGLRRRQDNGPAGGLSANNATEAGHRTAAGTSEDRS